MQSLRRGSMDFFLQPNYRIMRFFTVLIGQWPWGYSKSKIIARTLILLFFIIFFSIQTVTLIEYGSDFNLLMEAIPPFVIASLCLLKYCTCWVNLDIIKYTMEHLKHDWSLSMSPEEARILQTYTTYGKMLQVYYMGSTYCALGFVGFLHFLPLIFDLLYPSDEPRPRRLLFQAEYFVNYDKYFYPILIHMLATCTVVFTVSGAADLILLSQSFHLCGTLSIVRYRLLHIFDECVVSSAMENDTNLFSELSKKISECVRYHCQTIKYLNALVKCYQNSGIIQLGLIVVLLAVLLIQLCDAITSFETISKSIIPSIHIFTVLFIVFLNVLPGQILQDIGQDVFYDGYFSRWFDAPCRAQKSLLIILCYSKTPPKLHAYQTIIVSLQLFGMIIQTSMSYFTVLYSLRQ